MKKILVLGSPGSEKSVFSRKLNEITNIPVYHLDNIYHNEDKTHVEREEFEEHIKNILKEESYIIDGNYSKTLEMRIKDCDTCFLLDYPTEVCVDGINSRIGIKRDDFPWIDYEVNEMLIEKTKNYGKLKMPKIKDLLQKYSDSKEIIIFKTREESDEYIKRLKKEW